MADSQLLERLQSHAQSFDSLLSLIPADVYYVKDGSDNWQKKKQTPEQARAAKMAKLDPANQKSALDILKENEKKRKREETGEDSISQAEKPQETLSQQNPTKKQRRESAAVQTPAVVPEETSTPSIDDKKQKRKEKQAAKEEKASKKQLKAEKKAQKAAEKATLDDQEETDGPANAGMEMAPVDLSGLEDKQADVSNAWEDVNSSHDHDDNDSTASPVSKDDSPAFDFSAQPSGTSSISSIDTADTPVLPKAKNTKIKPQGQSLEAIAANKDAAPIETLTMEEKQERLRKRLAELRAARKADAEGERSKSRSQLLEERRQKQEQRKERKKELRRKAKEEEERKRDEEIARGSPLMSPLVRSPPPGQEQDNLAFGRVMFDNGQSMTADLSGVVDMSKKKGPKDLRTAMLAANAKNSRLAGLDEGKRNDIADKDMWLAARKRAHGEKPRDDQSLLKKALKRKDDQKTKSATEWNKRIEGVRVGKEVKQKKREANLAKRKEGKGKGVKSSRPTKPKQKKRPGFEGSFKAGGRKK